MADLMVEVTDSDFEGKVIGNPKPVLVDFWAPWCGPCQAMGPVLAALALKFGEKVTFAKCNVDDHPSIARQYGIKSIPTLILFKSGKPIEAIMGAVPQKRIADSIMRVLGGEFSANYFPMNS